ncbi:uncharacterized protein EV154DRAFT_484989 [Mucor mucedo]|uniref:uncharacterized protein n=1 Tax=Mucor mucedo TaxID=29922 RepID=UPI00221E93ED|nr:uncharacterized protein EV154DRAFT_484989 [Mucor mucedo]KAI7887270.1 hypothetical protein EV154DRAFT_484989 [Mucor mucedo]
MYSCKLLLSFLLMLLIYIGQHAVGNYKPQSGEWLDGKRVDILLIPITTITGSLPPVVIEIQNVVDKAYIHRLNQYCSNMYDEYCNIEPVVLTICIKSTRAELCKSNHNDPNTNDPNSIDPYSNNSSINNAEPLPPLLALSYVLMEQKCSLFGLQYKEDLTVILIYRIAKEALDHHLQDHQSTVDSLHRSDIDILQTIPPEPFDDMNIYHPQWSNG